MCTGTEAKVFHGEAMAIRCCISACTASALDSPGIGLPVQDICG